LHSSPHHDGLQRDQLDVPVFQAALEAVVMR
jgi:hypothetical protein